MFSFALTYEPQTLCRLDPVPEIKLIDLDWAGEAGLTVYPEFVNMDLEWSR